MFDFMLLLYFCFFFFFQAEDGIRDVAVTGVQTCALPLTTWSHARRPVRPPNAAASRAARIRTRVRRSPRVTSLAPRRGRSAWPRDRSRRRHTRARAGSDRDRAPPDPAAWRAPPAARAS